MTAENEARDKISKEIDHALTDWKKCESGQDGSNKGNELARIIGETLDDKLPLRLTIKKGTLKTFGNSGKCTDQGIEFEIYPHIITNGLSLRILGSSGNLFVMIWGKPFRFCYKDQIISIAPFSPEKTK